MLNHQYLAQRSMTDVGNLSESMVRVTTTISIVAPPLILVCSDEIAHRSLRITIVPPAGTCSSPSQKYPEKPNNINAYD